MASEKQKVNHNFSNEPVLINPFFKVLFLDNEDVKGYVIGLSGLNANGTVTFKTDLDILTINLKWDGYPLFGPTVPVKNPIPVDAGAGPGRYRFGFQEQVGFPHFIDIENDGADTSTFMVFRNTNEGLDLRATVTIEPGNTGVNFAAANEFSGTAKILSVLGNHSPLKLDLQNTPQQWSTLEEASGSEIVKVQAWGNGVHQTVGGAEAEIEIEPPMEDHTHIQEQAETKQPTDENLAS